MDVRKMFGGDLHTRLGTNSEGLLRALIATAIALVLASCAGQTTRGTQDRQDLGQARSSASASPRQQTTSAETAPAVGTSGMNAAIKETNGAANGVGADQSGTTPGKFIRITPWTELDDSGFGASADAPFAGAYTRLVVRGDTGAGSSDDESIYKYKDRGALARFFSGQRRTMNFSAKVAVGSSFTATIPLMTIDHVSNSTDGEGFTRVLNHRSEGFPLFLIHKDGGNENVSVQFLLKGTDQYQASAASAIATAQSVIKAVAPHSAVLTTLTQQSSKDAATAIDTTLGKLLATSIDEEHWWDSNIRRWSTSTNGPRVTLTIPGYANEGKWDAQPTYTVGTWSISFAPPRPSIFSDVYICPDAGAERSGTYCGKQFADAAEIVKGQLSGRALEVLNFPLVKGTQSLGTIGAYIKQQDWYTTAQKWINADKNPGANEMGSFCASIKASMIALDLNSFDSENIVWAVINAGTLPTTISAALAESNAPASCRYTGPTQAQTAITATPAKK